MRNVVIVISAILFGFDAYSAIDRKGNGGDVVVCPNNKIELLDFYEARTLRGIVIPPETSGRDYVGIVTDLIEEVSAQFPVTAARLRTEFEYFQESSIFLPGVTLIDVPDSEHIAIPVGCGIEQIAIQRPVVYPEDKFYTISLDLWQQLDSLNQAGLVFHEILYRLGLEGGISHSIDIRYLNSMFFSRRFMQLNEKQRFQVLASSRQPIFEISDKKTHFVLPVYYWTKRCELKQDGFSTECTGTTRIEDFSFFDEGALKSFSGPSSGSEYSSVELQVIHSFGVSYSTKNRVILEITREKPNDQIGIKTWAAGLELIVSGKRVTAKDSVIIREGLLQSSIDRHLRLAYNGVTATIENSIALEDLPSLIDSFQTYNSLRRHPFVDYFNVKFEDFTAFQTFMEDSRWQVDSMNNPIDLEIRYRSKSYPAYTENTIYLVSGGIKWVHNDGYIVFRRRGSYIYLDERGEIATKTSSCLSGAWDTPLGYTFEALEVDECLYLTSDKQFYGGRSQTRQSYQGEYGNFNYYGFSYHDDQDRVYFYRIEVGGTLLVQGKTLVVGQEIAGQVGLYLNGRPREILINAGSIKLKDKSGKTKTYKKHYWLILSEDGLVEKAVRP